VSTGPTNRFWIRAHQGPKRQSSTQRMRPGRWKWWVMYDSATGQQIGDYSDDFAAMVQGLRAIRSQHREPIDVEPVWPSDRKYLS
jgi:hypothetical protein